MSGNRPTKHAHKLVHYTAMQMAHELYDTMMQIDNFYTQWKRLNPGLSPKGLEARFVARNISLLVPQARATLAAMLRQPIADTLKEEIYQALLLDNTLLRGRGAGPSAPPPLQIN